MYPTSSQAAMPVVSPDMMGQLPVKPAVDPNSFFDYSFAEQRIRTLVQDWQPEVQNTMVRRKEIREVDINVQSLREKGTIKSDETIIPMRACDINIRREHPVYFAYIKQSPRLAIFEDVQTPSNDCQVLEKAFTDGMQYAGWERAHFKCIDGAQTHGWDWVELVFDSSKPYHVGIEHVAHDNLFFPQDILDPQDGDLRLRRYSITPYQLKSFIKNFGFDEKETEALLFKTAEGGNKKYSSLEIFKVFFKDPDGVVWVAWWARSSQAWLKAPVKLFLGRQHQEMTTQIVPAPSIDPATGLPITVPVTQQVPIWVDTDETEFPHVLLPYYETEQQRIVDHKGRAFYDRYIQEAQTAIISAFVNSATRASNVYGSPRATNMVATGTTKLTDTKLENGKLYNQAIDFWTTPQPSNQLISAAQALSTFASEAAGQTSFAANNRQDSRKTATEVASAQQQGTQMNSVQVVLFSLYFREVYTKVWNIVQSRALQGKVILPVTPDVLQREYRVKPAGDTDVVERDQKMQKMSNLWPLVQASPLAMPFLMDMIKIALPDRAEAYGAVMQQAMMAQQAEGAATTALKWLIANHPEIMKVLPPEDRAHLLQVVNPQAQQSPTPSNNGQQQLPEQSSGQ